MTLLFVVNDEDRCLGKNSLVTKETDAKVIGFYKKWLKLNLLLLQICF